MTFTRATLLALAVTLSSGLAVAQQGPTLEFAAGGFGTAAGMGSLDHEHGTDISYYALSASATTALSPRTVIRHQAVYRHVDQDLGSAHAGTHANGVLHSHEYAYHLSAEHNLSDRWTISASSGQYLQSHMQHAPGENSFYWTGAVRAFHSPRPSLLIGGGIAYSRMLGRPLVIPVLVASVQTERFELDAYLPERAVAFWSPIRSLSIGVTAVIDGNQYRTADLESLDIAEGNIRYRNAAVGPALRVRITETAALHLEGGATIDRSLHVVSGDKVVDLSPESAAYFRIGFSAGIR